MPGHKRRIRQLQFDCMERREMLSGIASAAVSEQLARPVEVSFQLSASGGAIGETKLPDGSPATLDMVVGQANLLGGFEGQLVVEHTQGQDTGVAYATLYGTNGAVLKMTLDTTGDAGPGQVIRGTYVITGGAGALAGATGSGTITEMPSSNGNSFTIEMEGQITP
jgi:hypothetical protein